MDSRDVPEETKERVMQFYKHMYKGGQNWFHDNILRELPYDMQVRRCITAVLLSAVASSDIDAVAVAVTVAGAVSIVAFGPSLQAHVQGLAEMDP